MPRLSRRFSRRLSRRLSRRAAMALLATAGVLFTGGVAAAVSGGGYSPAEQDCPPTANANNNPGAVPGCHNVKVNVTDGNGKRYAEVGLDQLPQGPSTPGLVGVGYPGSPNFPHAGCAAVNTNGTNGGPGTGCGTNPSGTGATVVVDTQHPERNSVTPQTGPPDFHGLAELVQNGVRLYLGADDNLDAGEHDGVDGLHGTAGSANGPSDGGAVQAHVTPGEATNDPSLTNPVPVAGASEGACADGLCQEVTTQQQTVYHGGRNGRSRNVYDYSTKQWDPYECSSGSPASEQACPGGMDSWRAREAQDVNAQPGVQVYEDPDPQASPIDPLYEAGVTPQPLLYPIPSAYAGTCGVTAGGGAARAPAGTPATNGAGQVSVSTGC